MLFFGLFVCVVLPIFLIYSAGVLKKSDTFKHTAIGEFMEIIFYLFAGMAILCDILIIGRLLKLL